MEEEAKRKDSIAPYPEEPLHGRPRTRAFFELQVGESEDAKKHRVVFELAVSDPHSKAIGDGDQPKSHNQRKW